MNHQSLFSGKIRKNIFNLPSAELAMREYRFKKLMGLFVYFFFAKLINKVQSKTN